MNKLLAYLTSLFGTSGHEGDIRKAIINEISPFVQSVRIDRMKNVIAFKKGENEAPFKLMVCAHMDEVGLMITGITNDGLLKFGAVGGIDPRVLPGKQVIIGKNKIPGVIGFMAIHLQTKESQKNAPKIDDLYIDIGALDKKDAMQYVSVGDVVGFENHYRDISSGLVRAKALDDRVGVAAMIEMISSPIKYDTYFVFTTMEEIGCAGAKVASFDLKPDYAIVLEATTAADFGYVNDREKACALGEGPVLSFMDKGVIYNRKLFNLAVSCAKENDIPYQIKKAVIGANDSRSIQMSASSSSVLAISVPCRYLHTPIGMINQQDADNMKKLTTCLIEKIME